MAEAAQGAPKKDESPTIAWAEFLTTLPPGVEYHIKDLCTIEDNSVGGINKSTSKQPVKFYCPNEHCETEQIFDCVKRVSFYTREEAGEDFIAYCCRNCRTITKKFAIIGQPDPGRTLSGRAIRIGEYPRRITASVAKVKKLLAKDEVSIREFDQGLASESQGFGVGAFTYYRRVVWRQWKALLVDILKVAEETHADQKSIDLLKEAMKEPKFTAAVASIKDAIPPMLLIQGQHNPMTVLHDATSAGIHDLSDFSDAECLKNATYVRDVLTELAERMSFALKDRTAVNNAVYKLSQINQKKKSL